MLSINTIKSGIREKERYYTQDESLARAKNEKKQRDRSQEQSPSVLTNAKLTTAYFYGKGATKLGLKGAVTQEEFKSLFHGYKPHSQERIRAERNNLKTQERLAEDITLSPSKSFSIALHIGKDERLFEVQDETVKEVVEIIEQKYIQTRVQINGKQEIVNTDNLIAVLIPHHTSRDGDMQLHTHVVIFNGTKRADGQYRALRNEAIAKQKWLGHLYQTLLAQKVQKLGYKIRETKYGFELEGITRPQIDAFSKRSREMVEKLEEQGKEINHKNRDAVALTTRKPKNITRTLEEYRQQWRSEAVAYGITPPVPQDKPVEPKQKQTALDALNSAIAHLSELSVSFQRDKIYEYLYQSGLQSFSFSELETEIKNHPELISLNNNATEFTTVKALKREIDTVKQWLEGQNKAIPLIEKPQLEATKLNQGQRLAISRTLTSTDRHQIIHGLSGVGKTTALGILRNQLRETKVIVKGFAPTIEAAEILAKELDIQTNTVAHLAQATPENKSNQLWIVDEAGLMSANQAQTIVKKAELVGARLLLVGDKGQNSSIEAGSPLRSLMKHGATTHKLDEIVRQRNSIQKQAVELIARGNGSQALQMLENKGYVIEIEDREERSTTIAKEYLQLSEQERKKTLIVTGTNKERLAITQEIRKGLEAEGKLGKSITTVQLISRNLSKEQQLKINNYREGDYIQLFRAYSSTNLQKNQLYKVEKIQGKELVVSSSRGRLYRFNPAKYKDKQVFSSREMKVAVGDKLRWTAGSDKKKGQINGKQVTVAAIDELSLTVKDNLGQIQKISLLQPLPLDHNLVSTSYRAQGKSQKRVIVSATSDPTSSLEPFYVKISRQTTALKVYTENLENLRGWVQKSNTQQNPIELNPVQFENWSFGSKSNRLIKRRKIRSI
ncbi:MobF family relaxase [Myxosarcina sp. GI1]|uniref:MobF family relaxase n=1 Tax=Myxosarcina sp. GI1 TaxID=1541065 RepID=UPI00068EE959|nr:MobF family relaxase [Myxosarcina sp. GI1]